MGAEPLSSPPLAARPLLQRGELQTHACFAVRPASLHLSFHFVRKSAGTIRSRTGYLRRRSVRASIRTAGGRGRARDQYTRCSDHRSISWRAIQGLRAARMPEGYHSAPIGLFPAPLFRRCYQRVRPRGAGRQPPP